MPRLDKAYLGGVEIKRVYLGATPVVDTTASAPTHADIEAIPEVAAVFVADPAHLFTDAGVANVTADGDAVQQWHDSNGSGVVLGATGTGAVYHNDGSRQWVAGDGTTRLVEGTIPNAWKPSMTMTVAGSVGTDAGNPHLVWLGDPNGHPASLTVGQDPDENGCFAWSRTFGGGDFVQDSVTFTAGAIKVAQGIFDSGQGTALRVNNGVATPFQNTALYAGDTIDKFAFFGRDSDNPDNWSGEIFAVVVTVGIPSNADQDKIATFCGNQAGLSI